MSKEETITTVFKADLSELNDAVDSYQRKVDKLRTSLYYRPLPYGIALAVAFIAGAASTLSILELIAP